MKTQIHMKTQLQILKHAHRHNKALRLYVEIQQIHATFAVVELSWATKKATYVDTHTYIHE